MGAVRGAYISLSGKQKGGDHIEMTGVDGMGE
jgi:hypothetical protein